MRHTPVSAALLAAAVSAPASAMAVGTILTKAEARDARGAGPHGPTPKAAAANPYGKPPFALIAYSAIAVRKPRDRFGYEGRSHSWWFCDAHHEGVSRWFETARAAVGSGSCDLWAPMARVAPGWQPGAPAPAQDPDRPRAAEKGQTEDAAG